MNIRDFLIDNYIWILVVILLSIITVIGFLADTKKSKKKEDNSSNKEGNGNQNITGGSEISYQNPQMVNSVPDMTLSQATQQPGQVVNPQVMPEVGNYQAPVNMNNAVPAMDGVVSMGQSPVEPTQQVSPSVNTEMAQSPSIMPNSIPSPQPIQPQPVNPQQIGGVVGVNVMDANSVQPEPMYQPLSEQKPVIPPQSSPVMGDATIPTPVASIQQDAMMQANNNYNMGMNEYTTMNQGPVMETTPVMNQAPATPVSQAAPAMNMEQNPGMVQNPIPNPQMSQPQQTQAQPINFVYGPQSGNNQQM